MKKREYSNNVIIMSPLPVVFVGVVLIVSILSLSGFIQGYNDAIEEFPDNRQLALSTVESRYISDFPGMNNYVEINSLFSLMLCKKELNERYKLKNGYLTDLIGESVFNTDASDSMNALNDYLNERGIAYGYIQPPLPYATDDTELMPMGYVTNQNQLKDLLFHKLDEQGVSYLDLRINAIEDDYGIEELYYKGDSHWTILGSVWAHQYIVEFIDEMLGVEVANQKYFDLSNYLKKEIDCNIVGSHSNRTGVIFGNYDRIIKFIPIDEQEYRLQIPSMSIDNTGDFSEVFDNSEEYEESVSYAVEGVYLTKNNEYVKITNQSVGNETKIMLLNDSFSLTLAPYLAQHYKEVHMYDVREKFGGSPEEALAKIQEIKPDIVLQVRILNQIVK